jgi:hypothetical protein
MAVTTMAVEREDGSVRQRAVRSGLVDGAWEGQSCPSCGLPRISYGGRTSFLGIPYSVWLCTACEKRYRLWVTTLEDLQAAYAAAGLSSLVPSDEDEQPAGSLTRAAIAAERAALRSTAAPAAPADETGDYQEHTGLEGELHRLAAVLAASQFGQQGDLEYGAYVRWDGFRLTGPAGVTLLETGDEREVLAHVRGEGVWLRGPSGGVIGPVDRARLSVALATCDYCGRDVGSPRKARDVAYCSRHVEVGLGDRTAAEQETVELWRKGGTKRSRISFWLLASLRRYGHETTAALAASYTYATGEVASPAAMSTVLRGLEQLGRYGWATWAASTGGRAYGATEDMPAVSSQEWLEAVGVWVSEGRVRGEGNA